MIKLPRGKYYVGDPCYAIADKNWLPILEKFNFFENNEFEYGGKQCFANGTAYGDGAYYDKDGREYGVDAGLLSIMPLEICDGDSIDCGHILTFKKSFNVWAEGGDLHFDNNYIHTGDEYDDFAGCGYCGDKTDSCACFECGECVNTNCICVEDEAEDDEE